MQPKSLIGLLITATALAAIALACVTSKVISPATPASTNAHGVVIAAAAATTNIVVNQANLAVDCLVLQVSTAMAVSLAAEKEPAAVPALQVTSQVLSAIASGANTTNTSAQIIALLGGTSSAPEFAAVAALVAESNSLRTALLAKYGSTVAVQIGTAIDSALATGFSDGLANPPPAPGVK